MQTYIHSRAAHLIKTEICTRVVQEQFAHYCGSPAAAGHNQRCSAELILEVDVSASLQEHADHF